MTPEIWTIIGVGVAMTGLILNSLRLLKTDLTARMDRNKKELTARMDQNKKELTTRMDQNKKELMARMDLVKDQLIDRMDRGRIIA